MREVLRLGRRVMVTRVLDGATTSECLGTVVAVAADSITLAGRHGERIRVPVDQIATLHAVPPPRTGRGPAHLAVSIEDLERVCHDLWRASDEASLGEWVLRAEGGVTGRANSALVVGDPGCSADDALAGVRAWYGARRLQPYLQVPGPLGVEAAEHPIGAAAVQQGMSASVPVLVMTAARIEVLDVGTAVSVPDGVRLDVARVADDRWLDAYVGSKNQSPRHVAHSRALLASAPDQVFGTYVGPAGEVLGIGRVAFSPGWAGVMGVWTAPHMRRRGLASSLIGRLLTAGDTSTRAVVLQVESTNGAAIAAYRRLGFTVHHQYAYLRDSAPASR